jgi:hypothetical protein
VLPAQTGRQPLTHTGHRTDQRLHIDTMKYWPVSGSASLRFDVGGPNDLAPFLSLLGNELAEVLASPRGPCRPGRRVGPEHGHRGYHVHRIESDIAALEAKKPAPLGEVEQQQLMQLGTDLALAWSHPAATSATRKRILRTALSEIVVRVEAENIEMILHWQGGDHTALKAKKNGVGKHRWTIPEDTLSLVRELARLMPDRQIARLLNRAGKPTGRGNGWTQARVCSFRSHHGIAVHRENEWAEQGEITLETAAQIMDVSVMTALRMVRHGIIKGRQVCRGAPWVIKAEDVAAYRTAHASQRPLTDNPAQQSFDFQ